MSLTVTGSNLEQKILEAQKNTYTAYEIGEYYYSLANYEKAVEWYEKAVSGSPAVPMALYAMGYACQNGEGTAVDLIKSVQYYKAAAEKDIPQACYNLAFFYQNGIGVCRDLNKANRYCERATESLKRLVDASQEAKEQLHRVNLKYSQMVTDVMENESRWRSVSDESAQKSQKIGELETLITNNNKSIGELKEIVESKERKLKVEAERYDRMILLHRDTLRLIDKQNDDICKLKRQIDELTTKNTDKTSQIGILCGKNEQLENERSNSIQMQNQYHKELLAAQEQIDILKNRISGMVASCNDLKQAIELHQEKERKAKKQRNVMCVLSIALAVVAMVFFLL